jgi:hypothetical protein
MNEHHATLPGALEFNDGAPMISSKEKVLAVWPDADTFGPPIYQRPGTVFSGRKYLISTARGSCDLGCGETEVEAWNDAASHLK